MHKIITLLCASRLGSGLSASSLR